MTCCLEAAGIVETDEIREAVRILRRAGCPDPEEQIVAVLRSPVLSVDEAAKSMSEVVAECRAGNPQELATQFRRTIRANVSKARGILMAQDGMENDPRETNGRPSQARI